MANFEDGDINQLGAANNTAAVTSFTLYTVPTAKKALIMEVRSNNNTGTTHSINFVSTAITVRTTEGAQSLSFTGKVILIAGDTVVITKASSNDVRSIVMGIEVDA